MSRSRLNGDIFEFSFYHYLVTQHGYTFFDEWSESKYTKLCQKIQPSKIHCIDSKNRYANKVSYCMDRLEDSLPFNLSDYNSMKLLRDLANTSNDLELRNTITNKSLGISLKNNNLSLKHPRARSFGNLLDAEYTKQYIELNDSWYAGFEEVQAETFSECRKSSISSMYSDFTSLLKKHIVTCDARSLANYCCSIVDTDYIIKRNKNGTFTTYQNKIDIERLSINVIPVSDNTFHVKLSNNLVLSFRIHTASKRVTKMLSLKYDVKYVLSPLVVY